MNKYFLEKIYNSHLVSGKLPSRQSITSYIEGQLQLLFPQLSEKQFNSFEEIKSFADNIEEQLFSILLIIDNERQKAEGIVNELELKIPFIYATLQKDAASIVSGDPSAINIHEVIRSYPGFFAIAVYRIAHLFHTLKVPYLPRILSEYAHEKTGIDIHPGAEIGEGFCIDHGTGIVIGETAAIGNNVKMYQGVTLGALSVSKDMAQTKRHPTIEDNVVLYSGATILGGNTVVGANSIIGGNVWLIKSVEPNTRVYHKSQLTINLNKEESTLIDKIKTLNPNTIPYGEPYEKVLNYGS